MSTDFNQKGRKVAYVAKKDDPPYFALLQPEALDLANRIENKITACNQVQNKTFNAWAALGCYERFRGCIFLISRLAQHEKKIRAMAPQSINEMRAYRGAEVLIDFESLLFHGRGALDRVAFFISKQIYNQDCDKYSKLANVLGTFKINDCRASKLVKIITNANPIFEGIILDLPSGEKSLRSHLIHKSTASENTIAQFTLYCIAPQKRIAFDLILGDYPLFKSSQSLGKGLAFVVLNALSLYIGIDEVIPIEKCGLKYESRMVDYREYLSDSHSTNRFTIFNTTPSGFSLLPVSLSSEILNKAY